MRCRNMLTESIPNEPNAQIAMLFRFLEHVMLCRNEIDRNDSSVRHTDARSNGRNGAGGRGTT